jgi:oligopeptidase B
MGRDDVDAPVARREPEVRELHGARSVDEYAWMGRDRDELLTYLEAERSHYDATTAHQASLRAALYDEMAQRLPQADESVGWKHGDWTYYTHTSAGKQYAEFLRRGADTEVLLDLNALAAGHDYFDVGVREVSPDDTRLAYSVDTDGDEVFELRIRDLHTKSDEPDVIPRSYYGCAWSADSSTVLYVVHDDAYRPYQVMRHQVGTPAADDVLIYQEDDERFDVYLHATRSGELVVITSKSRDTSEIRLLSTADVAGQPWVVAPRRGGIDYEVEHAAGPDGGSLYIVTNDGAPEFRLVRAAVDGSDPAAWVEVIAGVADERLVSADAFRGYLVLTVRRDGSTAVRVMDLDSGALRLESAGIPAGTITVSCRDPELERVYDPYDSDVVTVVTESLIEPPTWWSIDLASGDREQVKVEPVPTYDPASYVTERFDLPGADGTRVPVTIAHRADVLRDGTAPCMLYGYGAYEASIDPSFDRSTASLLDRGVVCAIAHIRGGGEGGREWWEQGRLRRKRTTFTDFIAVADGLAAAGYVDGSRIVSRGRSAGGLLAGATFSMAPARWRGVIAEVPFVDVVTTMLDPTIPLTVGEWDEWGDPRNAEAYDYMASYSPYDNVPLGPRPELLVTGSLNDPRVMIREPAKWVARLRATGSDDARLLFRAEVGSAAHTGASGRYDVFNYEAEIFAFILESLGVEPPAD